MNDVAHHKHDGEIETRKDCPNNHASTVKEDRTEDYELLVKGLISCAKSSSITPARSLDRIFNTTKELHEKRRNLRLILMQHT
ncbi:hypothetical protein KIN20_017058 [Parelaphostrongylus tenuis]|uniref:Uncharacterized protein n=1 Tax=Parelaphostrongylus tenuis TaxID=148309 RepID=A0AAD5N5Z7_PARTN|nr:hypothetical protein KIN20_017058 [Parelaphostrongylus tenuis]